ncbi:tRNA uridine-5-carboxymethylaminomethyl(34) synthesis GTPase MnmE [Calorimonas adulescens]|jgi:tRNA modification GTPase trmE|uniref:tRNA modification GTPase MnmE n=1 Tax=Calorimonas adulescens TaxID=2606906 RepID=A0A5D8Q9H1_9THEO|nr:tRNA uridine-5-carboxymethylaminomethyl(34) synthesis GTPase MnmE [Calorimonas adulescens]
MNVLDTIAAISTPPGEGGIGIVRLSGDMSIDIASRIFKSNTGKRLDKVKSHCMVYGHIVDPDTNLEIDEVLVSVMKAPHTYTREDIVEINCHGGFTPLKKILELCLRFGARPAGPGEFTKRAFINGRIDLAQAEAVMDIIRSNSDDALKTSVAQLEGKISREISDIRSNIVDLIAHIDAYVDFPEEDVEELSDLKPDIERSIDKIEKLITSASTGKILREGLKTVIIGKPNVGKSSLLNALLKEERAIVTEIPGTTRDIIEEYINIKGVPVKLIDTAGIRDTNDIVERIGVEKTKKFLEQADLVILMFDSSLNLTDEDMLIIELVKDKKVVALLNKSDLPSVLKIDEIERSLPGAKVIRTSLLDGMGLDELTDYVYGLFYNGDIRIDDPIITNTRHLACLKKAVDSLRSAVATFDDGKPVDLITVDLMAAVEALGEITGETAGEEIIDRIFQNFCVGK